jgi:predicted TIM-barrel fold metal-dependent hydrolase
MIIDCHCHVFPPQVKKNRRRYIESDPCFALLYSDSKAKLATAEELITSMDRAGIETSVILNIGWTTHELCVETNDYILESIAHYPNRLIGFCSVQPLTCDAALNEIERCAEAGIRGVGELRPDIQMFDLMDEQVTRPMIGMMVKHKLAFLSHTSEPVGHEYPGKGKMTPGILYPFIKSYPELKIICAHWGGGLPFYNLMPEVENSLKNVFFDSAASPLIYRPEIYRYLTQIAGAGKILFGSDYPLIEQRKALKEVKSLDLLEEDKNLILGGNAAKIFDLKD